MPVSAIFALTMLAAPIARVAPASGPETMACLARVLATPSDLTLFLLGALGLGIGRLGLGRRRRRPGPGLSAPPAHREGRRG